MPTIKDNSKQILALICFILYILGAGPDNINITPKRSTFNYNLPNTVTKTGGQIARIQQEDLLKDYTKDPEKQYSEAKVRKSHSTNDIFSTSGL